MLQCYSKYSWWLRCVRCSAARHRADPRDGVQSVGHGGQCRRLPGGHHWQHRLRHLWLPVRDCGDVLRHGHVGAALLSLHPHTGQKRSQPRREETFAKDDIQTSDIDLSHIYYLYYVMCVRTEKLYEEFILYNVTDVTHRTGAQQNVCVSFCTFWLFNFQWEVSHFMTCYWCH